MSPKNLQGFTALPLYFSGENSSHHTLFIKEHNVRAYDENKPAGRTLFVINVPPYANKDGLKRTFSSVGKIKSVILQESVNDNVNDKDKHGFKVAYIVFEKREALLKSLRLEHLNPLSSSENPILTGLNKWIHEYNSTVYSQEKLNEEINMFIKNRDKEEDKKADKKEKVDDEGWTVVTKKGRNPGISRKQSVENKIIQKNKIKSRKKELKNFYTFQLKEQKMKNIVALRKSFQESKEKVNLMKKLRKFNPF